MNLHYLSNSNAASSNLCIMENSEPIVLEGDGIYIGKTETYKRPFFLQVGKLLNPHIAAIGMTGSGKTYFLRSYIIRSRLHKGVSLLIIDWNGEYDDTVGFLDGRVSRVGSDIDVSSLAEGKDFDIGRFLDGVCSISLAQLKNDAQRRAAAVQVVELIIEKMHSMPIAAKTDRLILLDEAWKMLGGSGNLGRLFREGRKYGFNIIVATQLVKDVNNEILSNAGCVFVFRLQNDDDFSVLTDTGILAGEQKERLPGLSIGSCLLHIAQKQEEEGSGTFFIKRIDGFSISMYKISCGSMQVKISSERFQRISKAHLDQQVSGRLLNYVEANERSVDLLGILRFLAKNNVERSTIVIYLRLLGVDDLSISSAYESMRSAAIEA